MRSKENRSIDQREEREQDEEDEEIEAFFSNLVNQKGDNNE